MAFIAAFGGNILYSRPKIRITFDNVTMQSHSRPDTEVDGIGVNIVNDGGRPVTVFFPDFILPDKRSNGNTLYLRPFKYKDVRKMNLTPYVWAGNSGKTPPFPYPLGAGMWNEVWIENTELAAELKKLGYDSGEVNLKVRFRDASQKPYEREIRFDVDSAKLRLPEPKVGFWSRLFGGRKKENV